MTARLDRLLRDFAWDRMDRVFADETSTSPDVGRGLRRVTVSFD